MPKCRVIQATGRAPGAIAILQLIGDAQPALSALTGEQSWPIGRARLVRFGTIDEGLAVRLSEDVAQVMPHGGPRVVQRLIARLLELGVEPAPPDAIDPQQQFPEADDRFEALALAAVARAASPLAIDLLLDQPRRWRGRPTLTADDLARSARLDRLLVPPVVVVAGPPNVGKSTMGNALFGRAVSIALDQPGTTRDYTTGRLDLGGLVVDWHDLPGLREAGDSIEDKAIELARGLIDRADLLLAMTDPHHDWPDLPRKPDLHVLNKVDLLTAADGRPDAPSRHGGSNVDVSISALTGEGLSDLVTAVRERLVPSADLAHPGPWKFDPRLD